MELFGALTNGLVAVAYFAICSIIVHGLRTTGQLRTNALGAATAAIFFTCGVGHMLHASHLLVGGPAFDWHMAVWDSVTAAVGLMYLSLRHSYGTLLQTPAMFESVKVELDRTQALHETVVSALHEGIVVQDTELRIIASNPRCHELLGLTAEQMADRTTEAPEFQAIREDGSPWLFADRPATVALRTGQPQLDQLMGVRHAGGELVWLLVSAQPLRREQVLEGVVVSLVDVTDRRQHEARLEHLAHHDHLTGLLNRRGFIRELDRHVALGQRYGVTGGVLLLDLDHFKYVNDKLGHHAGDDLLIGIADALRDRLRATDVLARLGGDEFAVLLPGGDPASVEAVAEGIVEVVRRRAALPAAAVQVTASIGVVPLEGFVGAADELLVSADLAMYDAKEAGRDRCVVYLAHGERQPQVRTRITWAERLRTALDHDGMTLAAQPIFDLRSGGIRMHELLVRMRGPDGLLITPDHFLPTAERLGLVGELDRWVAGRAIDLLAEAVANGGDPAVAVNVSALSLAGDGLLRHDAAARSRTGDDPTRLTFEITETATLGRMRDAQNFAGGVRANGCRVAIDDFGAGFGSFSYLKHLPFDFLKIDGDFVGRAVVSRADDLIVEAVRDLAHGLGGEVVAEFVADEATERHMRGKRIDLAQGYHLGRPQDARIALGLQAPVERRVVAGYL